MNIQLNVNGQLYVMDLKKDRRNACPFVPLRTFLTASNS